MQWILHVILIAYIATLDQCSHVLSRDTDCFLDKYTGLQAQLETRVCQVSSSSEARDQGRERLH